MPIYQKLIDFDEVFHTLPITPVIINDLVNETEDDKEFIKNVITTHYSSDMISLVPSCLCGYKKGEYAHEFGETCDVCGHPVKSFVEDAILPGVWFRRPKGLEHTKLISPIIWIMLKNKFSKSGFNIIQWLADTKYRPNVNPPKILEEIIASGIQRGYSAFVNNFDIIIDYLYSLKDFRPKKGKRDFLYDLLKDNKNCIFSEYIPLPNKSLLVINKTNVGNFGDMTIMKAIDAIQMLVSIDKNFWNQSVVAKENRTIKAIVALSSFYEDYFKNSLAPKPGQFRKHIFATRTIFSGRAVITSLTGRHEYDELHIPWGMALVMFRPHLLNKLGKMGMDLNSATGLLLGSANKYNSILDRFLNELLHEVPSEYNNGIPVIFQRSPSLKQGSDQFLRITKIKSQDLNDYTISLSILVVSAYNADKLIYAL